MLTADQFDSLTRECLDPLLVRENGFQFAGGTYYRELVSRIRHVVIIDLEPRMLKEFRVIVGLNSTVVCGDVKPDEAGVYFSRFLTIGAVSSSPQKFRCFNDLTASDSLNSVADALNKHGLPWFESYRTLCDFARELGPDYDFLRGRLFFAEKQFALAKKEFLSYQTRLKNMPPMPRIEETKVELEEYLKHCGE